MVDIRLKQPHTHTPSKQTKSPHKIPNPKPGDGNPDVIPIAKKELQGYCLQDSTDVEILSQKDIELLIEASSILNRSAFCNIFLFLESLFLYIYNGVDF